MFGEVSVPSLLLGGAGVGATYFAYLCATKGVKAALAWLKSEWASGAAAVEKVRADLTQLETGVVSTVKADVAALQSRVSVLEARATAAIPTPAPVLTAPVLPQP
ncbi:hypothetical protein [Bradyrhizobium uaiense]|uniref:Chemotaxis protein n=1 Tax=Bradyrhizobium uaiense TaxID=2594946 RepID=A0A6P1B8J1_9BRAD|nr:hypothetical protein [Bradyrhizobium uaiense]NEU94826.1 hypothetical protein [Bradyrhizobium uaiense]